MTGLSIIPESATLGMDGRIDYRKSSHLRTRGFRKWAWKSRG